MPSSTKNAPWRGPAPAPLRRSAALFLVFALAKAALLALLVASPVGAAPVMGAGAPAAWRAALLPLALLRQDALVALLLAALELSSLPLRAAGASGGRRLPGRLREGLLAALYAACAVYAAVNVPVARVLSTPLTYGILRAAGGALSDSLAVYLTWAHVAAVACVLGAAVLLPRLLRRPAGGRLLLLAGGLGGAALLLGGAARARLETRGLHRNAVFALLESALSQRAGAGSAADLAPLTPEPSPPSSLAPPAAAALRGAAQGRSLLWVVLESTGARYLRPYGAAEDPMPTLTALAARGLLFERVYAAYPESIKGLYSMLCANYPAPRTDVERYAGAALPCGAVAERFRAAGYRTGLFHSGWFPYLGMAGVVQGRGFDALVDAGGVPGRYRTSFGVDEAATVQRLLAFLDEPAQRGRPFFFMYLPIAGHHPYEAPGPKDRPRPFGGDSELARYRNDLLYGDRALGELLAALRRRGHEDAVVAISGDHGEAFYQHAGNFAHTLHLYEENVHVPFVLGSLAEGRPLGAGPARLPQVGSVIDIAPTLLDLCGVPPAGPAGLFDGRSLLSGEPGIARFFTDQALPQLGLRDGRYKFIYEEESGRGRLFDLAADPDERRDLAASAPARAVRYREHLLGFFAARRALLIGSR